MGKKTKHNKNPVKIPSVPLRYIERNTQYGWKKEIYLQTQHTRLKVKHTAFPLL